MKQSMIKVALSTTLTVGLAVSALGPAYPVLAQASSGISWSDISNTLSILAPIQEDNYAGSGEKVSHILTGKTGSGKYGDCSHRPG
ncbi:hypothetical protein [Paenibacillus macerans]|uniref:hypothetical protein n=1 Tax=Paenibacillus macerans TaxID=44252 RepID=UPI003D31E7BB